MAPPRGSGRGGYKKHGDEDASQPVHEPSSSSAQPVSGNPDGGEPNDGSSSDDKPFSGDGDDDFPEGEPSSNDEGGDDGQEEGEEEEEGTDDEVICPNCAMKDIEIEKMNKMLNTFVITHFQGFDRERPVGQIPDDRLELSRFIDQMIEISKEAVNKKKMMIDRDVQFAVYIYFPERQETKVIYSLDRGMKMTIKQMKVRAVQAFGIPKSHIEMFSWIIREGAVYPHHLNMAMPKPWNRSRVKTYFRDTSRIEMTTTISGGGKVIGKKKKADVSKAVFTEFVSKFNQVPSTPLVPFRGEAEQAMNELYNLAMDDPMKAFETAFSKMTYEQLDNAFNKTSSDVGGDSEHKLRRLAVLIFGDGLKKAKETLEICEGLVEGAELTLSVAFHHESKAPTLQTIRTLLKTMRERKLGAMEATRGTNMET